MDGITVAPHDAYPVGSGFLWRWVELPQDDAMAAFVSRYAVADDIARDELRSALTFDDRYTLLLFSRRSALRAIRTRDARAAELAAAALAPIDRDQVEHREFRSAESLAAYAAQRVTGALGAADADRLAREAGLREVGGPDGPVLVNDRFAPYAPTTDLVALALRGTALMEADGGYMAVGVTVAEVLADRGQHTLTGCASVDAVPWPDPGMHILKVYLAEATSPEEAAEVARDTDVGQPGWPVVGVASGRLCAVMVAGAAGGEQPRETAETLARFTPAFTDLLAPR